MERPPHFPGFFLVGAPRCGTTAMAHYLRGNPSVCFSEPKETFFFTRTWREGAAPDLRTTYVDRYFPHHDPARHRAMGEGSVSYLFDREALRRILAIQPEARFLVMVRDPLEMIPSYHLRLRYLLEEDVASLEEAWALQAERAAGRSIPHSCTDPRLLRYADVGRLGEHVAELFALAGRDRCHVVVFDDLVRDPRREYRRVLEFIGAELDDRSEFRPRQESKAYRFRWIQRLLFKPPRSIVKSAEEIRVGGTRKTRWIRRLRKRIMQRNRVTGVRPEVSPRMAEVLLRTFEEDVDRLGELLERDLSHWLGRNRSRLVA